ncbi:MAG TPA: hypothetical protein VHT00_14225 [Stellaceae bacterium]|jgi:hypothetical protein|nr:hypothetical protein [Stellaceae bacterium]
MSDAYGYDDQGLPTGPGPGPPADPTQGLPPWAMSSLAQQMYYEPQGTMWPNPNARPKQADPLEQMIAPDRVPFGVGTPQEEAFVAPKRAAEMTSLIDKVAPSDPVDLALTGATMGASLPWKMGSLAASIPLSSDNVEAGMGRIVRDPRLWHGVSDIKLARPLSEVPREQAVLNPRASPERLISPEDLQGSALVPVLGDRTGAGYAVTKIGDVALPQWVDLYGGHGFMSQDPEHIWASKQGNITGLAGNVRNIAEKTGKPVELVYSAMGPRAVDFSTFASDALAQQLKTSPISEKAAAEFNKRMIEGNKSFGPVPNFPDVRSPDLQQWLRDQPGVVRDRFAKLMDNAEFSKLGFPNVGETRHAIIDPRLMDVGLGDAGLSIARAHPTGITGPSLHPTYSTGLGGTYTGGLGTSVPFDVMFPDLAAHYAQRYPTTRFDKLATSLAGDVKHQETNQQWLDGIMRYLEQQK